MDQISTLQKEMRDLWNEKFNSSDYIYGKEPNAFFANELLKLQPGNILIPAEGEGRNSVFAAKNLWYVSAFDTSDTAKQKAAILARENQVFIQYEIADFENFSAPPGFFDCVALIFAHMPSEQRKIIHRKLVKYLKPGGTIILQAFSKNQSGKTSGGPTDPDWLYTREDIEDDFKELTGMRVTETIEILNEGIKHQGEASLISMVGKK